jgi:hypothetical protein
MPTVAETVTDTLKAYGTEYFYAAVARAMGAGGIRVSDPADVGPALREAVKADGPVLVDVLIDKEVHAPVSVFERVLPALSSALGARAGPGSRSLTLTTDERWSRRPGTR